MSKQRQDLLKLLIDFCNQKGSKTFSLQEIHKTYGRYQNIHIGGDDPHSTIRRLLQELRDKERALRFVDNSGIYTLGGDKFDFLLDDEKTELKSIRTLEEPDPEKREYIREIYYRKTKMVMLAKRTLGLLCLHPKCKNTFQKPDKKPYIEVHHIIPLHKGGTDELENLSVVCAHHHKMAHFADNQTKIRLEKILLKATKIRL